MDEDKLCYRRNKVEEIERILDEDVIDLWALRELCLTEGGLINDSLRRKIWPMFVGIDSGHDSLLLKPISKPAAGSRRKKYRHLDGIDIVDPSSIIQKGFKKQVMAKCLDARQIDLDIGRCTWHLLSGSQRSRRRQMRNKHRKKISALLKRKQRRLGNLINLVLIQSYANSFSDFDENRLRYYQGYHDIACIFLSALGGISDPYARLHSEADNNKTNETGSFQQAVMASKTAKAMGLDLPSKVLLEVSQSHLGDAMKSDFECLTSALRLIVMPLIYHFDPEVHNHLKMSHMEPFFCFSWIITWFSHDIRDTSLVKRLFDVFIVSHPLMPVYMSIAMVLHPSNREEVLNTECDFAALHKTLTNLPRNSCSVGWRFVGGGYISGEDDSQDREVREEVREVSVETASLMSDDLDRESLYGDDGSLAPSLSESTFSGHESTRVPFQELIDLSIKYMRHLPPRSLIKLAHKHHGKDAFAFDKTSSVNLFQPPSSWALRATSTSLKNCVHDRDTFKKDPTTENGGKNNKNSYPRATIACGMGLEENNTFLTQLCHRKKLHVCAVIVGIIAISYGIIASQKQTVPVEMIHSVGETIAQSICIREKDMYDFEKILIREKNVDTVLINNEMLSIDIKRLEENDEELHQNETSNNFQDLKITPVEDQQIPIRRPGIRPGQLIKNMANSAKAALAKEAEAVVL